MRRMFSANLGFLFTEGSSLIEQYKLAQANGFKAIEHPFPLKSVDRNELLRVKEENALNLVLVNIEIDDDARFGCAALPGKEEDFKMHLKNTINFAKTFNCQKIHLMSGIEPSPTDANRKTFQSNLKYAATQLEESDIIGVIEPINNYSAPGYFLNDYVFAMETIREVGSKNIKLMADIFHMQMITGNITNNLRTYGPFIGHVQIAQAPNRNEPDSNGELNYPYILNEIINVGYNDFIGLEYRPLSTTSAGLKWINKFGFAL